MKKSHVGNVKPFICHEHKYVRKLAIRYLSKISPMDLDLMTWAGRGVEKYGLNEFGHVIVDLWKFPQTEASISWTIEQLAVNDKDVILKTWLNRIIAGADIDLVFPMLNQLKNEIWIAQRTLELIKRRHSFAKLSTEKLWEMLMQFSKESEDKYVNEMDYAYGEQIVEVIAEREDAPVSKILEMLTNDEIYHGYDEIYCIILAGRLRLEQAIPILIDKMAIDGDLICEEAVTALSRIGSEDVLKQVSQRFIGESWHF